MALRHLCCLALVLSSGCATAGPDDVRSRTESNPNISSDALCDQARTWDSGDAPPAKHIVPKVDEGSEGRTYHFDLSGRAGLRTLDASCGWGSYAECNFEIVQSDGAQYQFSELSTFSLWEFQGSPYLLYRIIDPKDKAAAARRRLVKVGNPPIVACNTIGDYSDVM